MAEEKGTTPDMTGLDKLTHMMNIILGEIKTIRNSPKDREYQDMYIEAIIEIFSNFSTSNKIIDDNNIRAICFIDKLYSIIRIILDSANVAIKSRNNKELNEKMSFLIKQIEDQFTNVMNELTSCDE